MAQVKINDKEYEFDNLSDTAKANLVSLKFVQDELKRLESQIAQPCSMSWCEGAGRRFRPDSELARRLHRR